MKSTRTSRWGACLLVAWVAAWQAPKAAWAAEDVAAQAEKLIKHGIELRRAHDDEAAQREFQKAYELAPTPRSAGQLGLAEQALGRWEDAERHLGEAIRSPADPWVVKNRAALDQAIGTIQAHVGRIEVIGDPDGAMVSINGREVGRLPLPRAVRVSAGEVDLEAKAPGYASVQRTVSIVGGQYQKVVIHLAKDAPPPRAEPAAVASSSPSTPVVASSPVAPAAPEPGTSRARPIVKWTAAGLAGAGLLTGVVFTVLHSQANSKFTNDGCFNDNGRGVDKTGNPTPPCPSELDTLKADQLGAIVGYAAAGAFAVTWLVLQLTEPSYSPEQHAYRGPVCSPALSRVGVSCGLRF